MGSSKIEKSETTLMEHVTRARSKWFKQCPGRSGSQIFRGGIHSKISTIVDQIYPNEQMNRIIRGVLVGGHKNSQVR